MLLKKLLSPILKSLARWYIANDRNYSYKGLKMRIKTGVFHPGLFFSTKILVRLIEGIDLKNKTVLELGAGSGLISFVAARMGAEVTATDVNPIAIENLKWNATENGLKIEIIASDLFREIPVDQHFDYILINPPYYPRTPKNDAEKAWYCGPEFEYFHQLFAQLPARSLGKVWMILSEDCDLEVIQNLANQNGLKMTKKLEEKGFWERNFVFDLKLETKQKLL